MLIITYGAHNPADRCVLHDITEQEGLHGLEQRLTSEIMTTDWSDEDQSRVLRAIDDAILIHQGEMRGNYPYATHSLRIAIRLMSRDHLAIRDDPDLIIAALMHDVVEDESWSVASILPEITPRPEAQMMALQALENTYGTTVAHHVQGVSTPPYPREDFTQDQKWQHYHVHVRELLQSGERAALIKLADFIDNCSALAHHEDPQGKHAHKLSGKYSPVIQDFKLFARDHPSLQDPRVKLYLTEVFQSAITQCELRLYPAT